MTTQTTRVNVRVTRPLDEKAAMWADKLGISKSLLYAMAIQAGMDSIIRAVSPVDSITPQQWADIVTAIEVKKAKEGENEHEK